ncbi:hypothetical protein BZM27_42135 [Paraburkholderia steynii]|uniref:Uncharacterized protein n=1 Tax=Paraburkholderia steynii TaxID=1245441 RepID=A0A4V2NGB4_9BURK|nr:hypothetical protein BZM27_42135 [Paraburkholderia steynii]
MFTTRPTVSSKLTLIGTVLSATGAGGGVSSLPDVPVSLAGVTAQARSPQMAHWLAQSRSQVAPRWRRKARWHSLVRWRGRRASLPA